MAFRKYRKINFSDLKVRDISSNLFSKKVGHKNRPSEWYYKLWRGGMDYELIKERKPCYVGDVIHLHSRRGLYYVANVTIDTIVLKTKWYFLLVDWNDYRCHAGFPHNNKMTQYNRFKS
jgi:hypothetical protein